jgi:HEPN/RES N-terminal domain 1/RES domain
MSTMHDVDDSEIEATYPDKFLCADCFDDGHVKAFIEDSAARRRCTYCGKRSQKNNIAAPVDDVIERLFEAISRCYGDAWTSGSSWDSEDQRYLNETWDTEDIVSRFVELSQDDSTELYQDIVNAFPSRDWSSVDPWSSTYAEILEWGWTRFVNAVKHHRRFFFTRREEEDDILRDPESLNPGELLERFGKGCAHSGLIKTIPEGTTILRCRPRTRRSERFTKARELGPPPSKFARQNRMSPAGIPMFYGSDNKQTALAEMPQLPKHYAIGEFETLRPLRVLDLTNVKYPSIFRNGSLHFPLMVNDGQFLVEQRLR